MNKSSLIKKLNDMFDIDGAVVTKTQSCPTGRWVCSAAVTVFCCAVTGVLVWGANRYLDGSLFWFLLCLIIAAAVYVLLRVWLALASDLRGAALAERCLFLRRGGERYCYTRSKYTAKFEYSGGLLALSGGDCDRFENKQNYSPLASRYSKSLQRRSSMYNTLAPSFWAELMADCDVSERDGVITAAGADGKITVTASDGKISSIEYFGKSSLLFDSLSPVKFFNGKFWGRYKFKYVFRLVNVVRIEADERFYEAAKEYLMPLPKRGIIKFAPSAPYKKWLEYTNGLLNGQDAAELNGQDATADLAIGQAELTHLLCCSRGEYLRGREGLYKLSEAEYNRLNASFNTYKCGGLKLPIGFAAAQDNRADCNADVTKSGFMPQLKGAGANADIYLKIKKPLIHKTAVRDMLKLIEIYGGERGE